MVVWCFTERREDALRHIALAFPGRDEKWRRKTAFRSVVGMFEMFAMPMVLPWLSEKELRRRFKLAQGSEERFKAAADSVAVLQAPHCSSMEAMAVVPLLLPSAKIMTIYRALDFKPADKYVLWARERWGMKLLSRQDGLLGIRRAISEGYSIGILFDQNALHSGALILSFGRVCSATDLPGILASKMYLKTYLIYARRTGFLSATFDLLEIENDGTDADITTKTALTFENIMSEDDEICANWMWAHRRWKSPLSDIRRCLGLEHRKIFLDASLKVMKLDEFPRRQPYCLRLPNDFDLAKIAIAWLPKLREARKDVRWIVVAPAGVANLLEEGVNCDRAISFEPGCADEALREVACEWPEIYFGLETSSDSRIEGTLCKASRSRGLTTDPDRKGLRYRHIKFVRAEDMASEKFDGMLRIFFEECNYREPVGK